MTMDLLVKSTATWSQCRKYRYTLRRVWNEYGPVLNWLMLNPSTADEDKNDPTVERCQRRSEKMGFGGFVVTNLFAIRSTDPQGMLRHPEPVGAENDAAILQTARDSGMVICAWGSHGGHLRRNERVLDLLRGLPLYALRLSKEGHPMHPLYLPYELTPQRWSIEN